MQQRIRRNVLDVFFRCMQTRDRSQTLFTLVISQQQLDLSSLLPVIPSVMSSIRLSLSLWNSQSQLSSSQLSLKQKLDRASQVKHQQNLLKKILHSVHIQIRKLVRQSLPEWVSYIWRSSLTVCFVSSRQKQTQVLLRQHTKRHLQRLLIRNTSTLSSPVVVDSTDIVRYVSSRWMPTEKNCSSSIPRLSVVLFRRNTSQQSVKVLRKLQRLVPLADSLLQVSMLPYMTDLTMKSILPRWHSILPDLCVSRKLWLRQLQYYLSLS